MQFADIISSSEVFLCVLTEEMEVERHLFRPSRGACLLAGWLAGKTTGVRASVASK